MIQNLNLKWFKFLKKVSLQEYSSKIFDMDVNEFKLKEKYISSVRKLRKSSTYWGEKIFFDYARLNKATTILEVGANDGAHTKKFLNELSNDVFSMEINPYSFEYLDNIRKIYYERFKFIIAGASVVNNPVSFPIISHFKEKKLSQVSGVTGINKRNNTKEFMISHHMLAPVIKIDQLFKANLLSNNNILWIDVEGHALEVLKGIGIKNLHKCEMIYVEVESADFFQNGASAEKVYEFLTKNDFLLIFRDFQSTGQFNLIFKKKSVLVTLADDVKKYIQDIKTLKIEP